MGQNGTLLLRDTNETDDLRCLRFWALNFPTHRGISSCWSFSESYNNVAEDVCGLCSQAKWVSWTPFQRGVLFDVFLRKSSHALPKQTHPAGECTAWLGPGMHMSATCLAASSGHIPLGRLGFHFTTLFFGQLICEIINLVWFHRRILGKLFCEMSCALFTISVVSVFIQIISKTHELFSQLTFHISILFHWQTFWELITLWKVLCGFQKLISQKNVRGTNCEIQGVSTVSLVTIRHIIIARAFFGFENYFPIKARSITHTKLHPHYSQILFRNYFPCA